MNHYIVFETVDNIILDRGVLRKGETSGIPERVKAKAARIANRHGLLPEEIRYLTIPYDLMNEYNYIVRGDDGRDRYNHRSTKI